MAADKRKPRPPSLEENVMPRFGWVQPSLSSPLAAKTLARVGLMLAVVALGAFAAESLRPAPAPILLEGRYSAEATVWAAEQEPAARL
jgi:hypothetical protein